MNTATAATRRERKMIARLYDSGYCVRVDLGNTGENWPNCKKHQPGFPWLSFGKETWQAAERWARSQGATEIIRSENEIIKSEPEQSLIPLIPTTECRQTNVVYGTLEKQMNAIYNDLEKLHLNGQQLLDLFEEAKLQAVAGLTEDDRRQAALFLHRLWEYVSRRWEKSNIAPVENPHDQP